MNEEKYQFKHGMSLYKLGVKSILTPNRRGAPPALLLILNFSLDTAEFRSQNSEFINKTRFIPAFET